MPSFVLLNQNTTVIIEAIDPIGTNIIVGGHIEGLSKEEGDNKIIIEANFKATADSLILRVVAITIITMVIIKAEMAMAMVVTFIDHVVAITIIRCTMVIIEAEVAMAMVVTFIDHMVMEEAIVEAITIIHTINITHMMMEQSLHNMVHHALFVKVSIILLNMASSENITSIILWRK